MGQIRTRGSRPYSIRFYDHTGRQREECGFKTKSEAKRALALREGSKARGEPVAPGHVCFNEAMKDVITHYKVNGLRSLPDAERRIEKLERQKRQLNTKLLETTDTDEALQLHDELTAVARELTPNEERWVQLHEAAEADEA